MGRGEGAGDNITVDPVFLIVGSSAIQANAFGGAGGKVRNLTRTRAGPQARKWVLRRPLQLIARCSMPLPQVYVAGSPIGHLD